MLYEVITRPDLRRRGLQRRRRAGAGEALHFIFAPHFGDLTMEGVLEALGHAFFTLSLGMGAMITYGSYLSKRDRITSYNVCYTKLLR